MNDYSIENFYNQKKYSFLKDVIEKTLKYLDIKNSVFSIILTSDEKIKEINKNYRNIDKITDVISFAFEDKMNIKNDNIRVLGDIYISIPQMERQAKEYEHSEKRELSFLTVHGLLHLLGYDHMNEKDEKIMFDLQRKILDEK